MIMAKIIKRTDSLTEPPLTTASRRSLPPRGSRIIKNDSLTELPLTTASRRSLPPRGSREQRLTIFADFCDSKKKEGEAEKCGV